MLGQQLLESRRRLDLVNRRAASGASGVQVAGVPARDVDQVNLRRRLGEKRREEVRGKVRGGDKARGEARGGEEEEVRRRGREEVERSGEVHTMPAPAW